jgi:hypothetical protein
MTLACRIRRCPSDTCEGATAETNVRHGRKSPFAGRFNKNRAKKCLRYANSRTKLSLEQCETYTLEDTMGFGQGLLLWLIGIPMPIIVLLALFMHH